ncbi:MAG: alpha/beta fold hydrolase, partial [Kangiellaceae bacterium]
GVDDSIAPVRTGKALLGKIPNSTLIPISQAGHVPMKSKTVEFNDSLRTALTAPIQNRNHAKLSSTNTSHNLERVGQCKDDDVTHFEGNYAVIMLENCKKAKLINVISPTFYANHSIVNIENSQIGSRGQETKIYFSRLDATSSQFIGKLKINNSKVDFASVDFQSESSAFEVEAKSTLIFSLSTIDSALFKGNIHNYFQLENQTLEDIL